MQNAKQGLPWLADLALIAALAWTIHGWMQRSAMPLSPALQPASSSQAAVNVMALAAIPLFGAANNADAAKHLPVMPSTLNLKLVGTAVAGSNSAAIVKGAGNKQKVVMIGDTVMPGVVLKRISADAIEVEHQGRLERIVLPKSPLASNAIAVPNNASAMPDMSPTRPELFKPADPAAGGGKVVRNMSSLMREARLVPHFDHGKVDGILVIGVQPGSVFAGMGLHSGDVIRSLDKRPIQTPQRITDLYHAVIDSRPIDIGVQHNDQTRQLHYKPATP